MRDEIEPINWTLQYPLGRAANLFLSGDLSAARGQVEGVLDRLGSTDVSTGYAAREEYRAEEFTLGRSIRLADDRLIPLWVADRNLKLGDVFRPTTMSRKVIAACALRVFLESIDE